MGPIGHMVVSGAAGGAVYLATGSPMAGAATLGVGVLLDLDHVYDYYQWYVKGRRNKLYIWLHAWEYSAAGILVLASVWYHPLLVAFVVGHLSHVTADHLHNRLVGFGYSLLYRLMVRFERVRIITFDQAPYHNHWPGILQPLRRMDLRMESRVRRWFEARAETDRPETAGVVRSGPHQK